MQSGIIAFFISLLFSFSSFLLKLLSFLLFLIVKSKYLFNSQSFFSDENSVHKLLIVIVVVYFVL